MKPPPFEYRDPGSVDDALGLLREHGEGRGERRCRDGMSALDCCLRYGPA